MLTRPTLPAFDELDQLRLDLTGMEARAAAQLTTINAHVHEIARALADVNPEVRRAAVAYLYWQVPEVRVGTIAAAFGMHVNHVPAYVGPAPLVTCTRCQTPIPVESRHALGQLLMSKRQWLGGPHCVACAKIVRAEYDEQRREAGAAQRARLAELRAMSYAEYRKTPEWAETRAEALRWYGQQCEICDAREPGLEVYHRYDRQRGVEGPGDVIVLCPRCASVIAQVGKLVQLPETGEAAT